MSIRTIDTWLPVFESSYFIDDDCSRVREDIEYTLEDMDKIYTNKQKKFIIDNIYIANEIIYDTEVEHIGTLAMESTAIIQDKINDILNTNMGFYYQENKGSNVDIQVDMTENDIEIILKYLQGREPIFAKYIKDRYTDRDGFWSHYSNDHKDWIEALKNKEHELTHELGAVFSFILDCEKYTSFDLYQDLSCTYICYDTYNIIADIIADTDYPLDLVEYEKLKFYSELEEYNLKFEFAKNKIRGV